MSNYWQQIRSQRLSRRRAMTAGGSALGVAALVVACGDSDGKKDTQPVSSLISPVTDETKSAKRGGVIKTVQGVPLSLDPHQTNAGVAHVWHNYSPLFKVVEGQLARAAGEMEGEAVDSWELSPDKTTLTLNDTDSKSHEGRGVRASAAG
jgi:hypothetical protein